MRASSPQEEAAEKNIYNNKERFRRKLRPKGVARMYPVLLDLLRGTHSLTYSERSRPGRLLDTPIRRSRGKSKQSREETKPVHSRDDQKLLRGALTRMSSPQNITDMCNQIFKDLEKDERQSTWPSSKVTDPRSCCSKQEQIIQELKTKPSKVTKETETEKEFSPFCSKSELVISSACDELTCFEPVQQSSLVSVSQVSEEKSVEEAKRVHHQKKNNRISLKGAKANTILISQRFGDGST
ncbi:hypothetical protein F2Q70_00043425 [Brassica cretica]|uniref:Uncharacterized protein n=1 Tax=Brassica cretica TaxID=69181 RepID=A0A8S9KFQ4_BRACR|nr:hypothetical protein F2Q70_00043425 [Brassica cretica]